MKKTLKLTSLLFTLILAVSVVFTGCGNGRKDSTTKGTTENNNDSTDLGDEVVETEGIFLNQKHTVKNCRKAYIPQVSLRTNLPEGMDPNEQLYDSMQARMDKQLAAYVKPELDSEIEKQLDDFMLSIGMKQEDIDKI